MGVKKKLIRVEADVRSRMRDMFGVERLFWAEHASGGTEGIPDVHLAFDHRLWPIELKRGERNKLGHLKCELRPAQKSVIRRLNRLQVPVSVICGEIGTNDLFMMSGLAVLQERWFNWHPVANAGEIELLLTF